MSRMLILPGIDNRLEESPAIEYARRRGYDGVVQKASGGTGPNSEQVTKAVAAIRSDPTVAGLYGFSRGGYNVHWIRDALSAAERARIKLAVVLGAPPMGGGSPTRASFEGPWDLVYRLDPPAGHMAGPQALLDELITANKPEPDMNRWPRDNQDDLIAFYGTPGAAVEAQLVDVVPPFRMTYEGKPIKAIKFHKKAAPALAAALDDIWEHYGKDQATLDQLGVSRYDGAYNPRFVRGSSSKWSNHAYGAAIDINAQDNGMNAGHGNMPQPVIDAFKRQGARWGGDYHGRTDPMHFEFCGGGGDQPAASDPHPLISLGATGAPVIELQRRLGIAQTGTFDQATDVAVRSFQKAHGLGVDGKVGPKTWAALPAVLAPTPQDPAKPEPTPSATRIAGLLPATVAKIIAAVMASPVLRLNWGADRGQAPLGYPKGMAVAFGSAYRTLRTYDIDRPPNVAQKAVLIMAKAPGASADDAMAWYADIFRQRGMRNDAADDVLRHLFVLETGLGMRESSGDYTCGQDAGAPENRTAERAEAGLFQQSWDLRGKAPIIVPMFEAERGLPDDAEQNLRAIFKEGATGHSATQDYGTGDGREFQHLCKTRPLFAVFTCAAGLRTARGHWGPINNRAATVVPAVDDLYKAVQASVDAEGA